MVRGKTEVSREHTLEALLDILRELESGGRAPSELNRRFRSIEKDLRSFSCELKETHDSVVGESAYAHPIEGHLEILSNIPWEFEGVGRTRVIYHLRLLGYCIAPEIEAFRPTVSVVIPVYNGRDCIERAVRSCLRQSYGKLEIIVVDDGSTDGTASVVVAMGVPVRLMSQEKATAAAARNRGMLASTGDFIHLLDADDEILPSGIEHRVSALALRPDMRLCYSHFEYTGQTDDSVGLGFEQVSFEDSRSATGDPILAVCSRFPFQASTMLFPRWYREQIGLFEESFVQAEDVRYWFRMARNGLRAVALKKPMTRRYRVPSSLMTRTLEAREWAIRADLASARELLHDKEGLRYIPSLMTRATWILDRSFDEGMDQERIEELHQLMLDFEQEIIGRFNDLGGTLALLIDQIALSLRQKCLSTKDATRPTLRLWRERMDVLVEAIREQEPLAGSSLRRWLPSVVPGKYALLTRSEQLSLKFALEQLQTSTLMGVVPIRLRTLERISADYQGHPYERFWGTAFRLAKLVGDTSARQIIRQNLFRNGWQLLGKAKRVVSG